jgi:hypothetical protein
MYRSLLLALISLSSCVTSERSISPGGLSSVQLMRAASLGEPAFAEAQGFRESLLQFEIRDTPLSLVVGYGSAEPSHVKSGISGLDGDLRAEARPALGFSVSF